jgi:hypothetical protein
VTDGVAGMHTIAVLYTADSRDDVADLKLEEIQ